MNRSIGAFILQLSVALYLFATGIIGFGRGGEIRAAVLAIFKAGAVADIVVILLAVCAVGAGVLLILELFNIEFNITEVLLIILIVVWVVFIILVDIIGPIAGSGFGNAANYLLRLGSHLMVLGGMICATKRFGSR